MRGAYWCRLHLRRGSLKRFPPVTAIAFEQVVGFPRAPRTGWIVGKIARRQGLPDVENGLHHAPTRFDHVSALKQSCVADHAFIKQTFVTGAGLRAEIVGIAKIHIDGAEFHDGARNFCAELQRNTLLRLYVHNKLVGRKALDGGFAEEHEGHAFELNDNFAGADFQPLSRAQIKWHAGPAPIVHQQFQGDKSLGGGARIHFRLRTIAVEAGLAVGAFGILATYGAHEHVLLAQRLHGAQHFGLLIAHGVRVKRNRRLHGDQADELKNVIRNHVAQRAGLIIVTAAILDAYGFRNGYLHMVNVAAVPDRLENSFAKAEGQDILHGLFAEVMINAINLIFFENVLDFAVERARGR